MILAPPIGGAGKTQRHSNATQKPWDAAFSGRFANFDRCRSKVGGDVISGVAVDYGGPDVRGTFGQSGLNSGQII